MNKLCVSAVLMLMCVLGIGIDVHAQGADVVAVSVPFEFVVGGATLPAGKYRVSRLNPGVNEELFINGYNKGGAFLHPLTFDDRAAAANQPTLSFEHVGGRYFLSKITTLNGLYTMPASRELVMLGKATPPSANTTSASGGSN